MKIEPPKDDSKKTLVDAIQNIDNRVTVGGVKSDLPTRLGRMVKGSQGGMVPTMAIDGYKLHSMDWSKNTSPSGRKELEITLTFSGGHAKAFFEAFKEAQK